MFNYPVYDRKILLTITNDGLYFIKPRLGSTSSLELPVHVHGLNKSWVHVIVT